MHSAQCNALVLAGGRASRFDSQGAVDKGLLLLGGSPLIAHSCRIAQACGGQVWISANRNLAHYEQYGHTLADASDYGDFQGPMAGLASCLERMPGGWVYVLPVDLPLLPQALFARLWQAAQDQQAKLAYVQAERAHPLCMLIHQDLAPQINAYLLSGQRRVMRFLEQEQALAVDCRDWDTRFFLNINTQQDLAQAEQLWQLRP